MVKKNFKSILDKDTYARKTNILKLLTMSALLAICFGATYYFHYVMKSDALFTHFFYIPIVLACMWWDWKGVPVALALSAFLILTHLSSQIGVPVAYDLTRGTTAVLIATVLATITARGKQTEKALKESNERHRSLFRNTLIPISFQGKERDE